MKIAVDCRMSGKSGIGTFLDGILPFFCESPHDFLFLGLSSLPIGIPPSARLAPCPCTIRPFSLAELLCFPRTLRKAINECDAYFSPYCNIPAGIRIPVYTTIHDVVFLDMKGLAGRFGTLLRKAFYRRAVSRSQALFTVSQFSKGRIIATLACKKPVHVVYNGIPAYLSQPVADVQKRDIILFIGNIKKHKGLSILLEAFSLFKRNKQTANAQLIIVGSKEAFRSKDKSVMQALAQSESTDIQFTGYIPDDELHKLLAQARILVQPSLYEGFGIPPLEALAKGTRALVSDIPVFQEIYQKLPVTFFKSGNAEDLAAKLAELWAQGAMPPIAIPEQYSYKKTAEAILHILTSSARIINYQTEVIK